MPRSVKVVGQRRPSEENLNQSMMNLIRRVHGLMETPDLEKQRRSQIQMGNRLGTGKNTRITEFQIGNIDAEWVKVNRPHSNKHVILYCHGGGYSTGSRVYARTVTGKLAESTSMDVLSFDYRLAPEHPYPAALEDAMRIWDDLMRYGYGARDIILAGDSAGGNLALSLTLHLKEQGRRLPRGLVLFSPWTDLTSAGESYQSKKELDPVLSAEYINQMVQNYAPEQDLRSPFLSPQFGDFTGFPPVYIQVGENEILYSDSLNLYERLIQQKVPAKMDTFKHMWHVFQMCPLKTAYEAIHQCGEFIYETFA